MTPAPALVTGGAGFIGSHLVDALLARGQRVRVLDSFASGRRDNLPESSQLEVLEADIRDLEACRRACRECSVVFHQAALGSVPRSLELPATSFEVNVQGTVNVFTAAWEAGVKRIVYASSSSVYGDTPELPKREGEEGEPISPYARSKAMNETLAATYARCYGLELIGLRYFNVYGPRQDPEGPYAAVVPRFIAAYRAGLAPQIHGDGEQSRDFTYVEDAVAANLAAAAADARVCGRAYNVAGGRRVSVNRLAATLARLTGSDQTPHHVEPRPGDVRHSLACLDRVGLALGYRPKVELEAGLRRTVAAYPAG